MQLVLNTSINMKFLIITFALVAAVACQQAQPVPIAILRQSQDSSPDGSYQFSYETDNGISVSEEGQPGPAGEDGPAVVVRGHFSYTAADGTPISVTYTADETGFHPEGAHLPVAPPVPEAIARSIQLNAASAASSNVRSQREQPKNYGRRF